MSELKNELASLRIDRQGAPPRSALRTSLLLLAPVALLIAALWFARARDAFGQTEVATVVAGVSQSSEAQAGAPILTASGYVVARRKAVVSAKIQGRLAELRVEEGSRVQKSEVIARLESPDYEASVARSRASVQRAEADLAEVQRQLRVAERLEQDRVLARDEKEAAESRVRIAQAGLAQAKADQAFAEAQLENTQIRAPFTGVVVKKMAEVGESVAPIPPGVNLSTSSGAIVALADLATLEVEADVAEANVAKLKADQEAQVTVEAFPGRTYKAVLRQVIPTADRTKATVQVKVTILDKDADLKPEMSAKVTFLEPARAVEVGRSVSIVSIPAEAVAQRDGRAVVFEVRERKVRQRPVTLGEAREGRQVVREGLSGGEVLVTRPPAELKDGDAVKVKG